MQCPETQTFAMLIISLMLIRKFDLLEVVTKIALKSFDLGTFASVCCEFGHQQSTAVSEEHCDVSTGVTCGARFNVRYFYSVALRLLLIGIFLQQTERDELCHSR